MIMSICGKVIELHNIRDRENCKPRCRAIVRWRVHWTLLVCVCVCVFLIWTKRFSTVFCHSY